MTGPRLIAVDTPPPPPRVSYRVRGPILPVFVERGAVAADRSIAFAPPKGQERQFAALVRDGTIKIGSAGGYWFDGVAFERSAAARAGRRVPWLFGIAVLLAGVAVLFYRG